MERMEHESNERLLSYGLANKLAASSQNSLTCTVTVSVRELPFYIFNTTFLVSINLLLKLDNSISSTNLSASFFVI